MKNLVAIVGRPNVGKSSLFNKLIGKRDSIVHDEPGVTRDRLYREIEWTGKKFQMIDTGGIEVTDRPFQEQIQIQAKIAIEEAAVIVFVVDGVEGLSHDDDYILSILRKAGKPILVAANKLEGNKEMDSSVWSTGVGPIFPISAIHGEGVGDLLDEIVKELNFDETNEVEFTKLAIIGRPNAGKSTLLNTLAGDERAIVSPIAGTTRDSVNSNIKINDVDFTVIDTAGINKKSKLIESVDHYALSRAIRSVEEADMVLLLIDVDRELAHFDSVVGGFAHENNKPTIVVVNKWDIANKDEHTMKEVEENVRKNYKFFSWAPVMFISAKTGARVDKLKDKIVEVKTNMSKMVKTNLLNEIIMDAQLVQPAQTFNGGRLNIKFVRQVEDTKIPTIIFWVNDPKYLHFSYERFLENTIREYFGFEGTPIRMLFRSSKGDKNAKKSE